jgi:hypothetical protein
MVQVSHLDGLSEKHFEDVADARRQRSPEEVKADSAEAALIESHYKGTGPRPDLVTNIWFGNCGAGHTAPDGHDGSPVVMPGPEWQDLLERADTSRREWRDAAGRKRETAVEREMSGQMKKIFARLTPWNAVEAGNEITREQVVAAAYQVALDFQEETGRRVLAANIHVESSHDIHVHLTHTMLVPFVSAEAKYSSDYLEKLVSKQRRQLRAEILARTGIKPALKEVKAEQERRWESGKLENPHGTKAFYRKLARPKNARRHLVSMNQAYCSKTALWEADGRSKRVASFNEQDGHHFTFEAVVVEAARRAELAEPVKGKPTGPEGIYIDCWLAKRWNHAIVTRLSPEARDRAKESAKDYIERYVRDGSSLPNPALDAARKKVADENAAREAALAGREQDLNLQRDQLDKERSDLEERIERFEETKKDIEMARERLRQVPLDELWTKLGFTKDEEGNPRAEIPIQYGSSIAHRILHTGQAFRVERFSLGSQKWELVGSGKGAIDLVRTLPPKPSFVDACEKLVSLFPDRVGGITLEALEHKGRQKQKNDIAGPSSPDEPKP